MTEISRDVRLAINPHVLERTRLRHGTTSATAVANLVRGNCNLLIRIYGNGERKVYWSEEDREALMVLMQNKWLTTDVGKAMHEDLARCEAAVAHEDQGLVDIMDNLGVLLVFVLGASKRKMERGLGGLLASYEQPQVLALTNLLYHCLDVHQTGGSAGLGGDSGDPETEPFVVRVCAEFLDEARDESDMAGPEHDALVAAQLKRAMRLLRRSDANDAAGEDKEHVEEAPDEDEEEDESADEGDDSAASVLEDTCTEDETDDPGEGDESN